MPVGKPLNDVYVKNLKIDTPKKKHYDTGGLFLFISPSGTKLWRMAYRFNGKEKLLSFGPYPLISLKEARDKRDDARKLLLDNVDPSEHKKAKIAAINAKTENSFEIVAREWFARNEPSWAESNSSKIIARLQNDIFPFIGSIPVDELTAPDILKALRYIESRGAIDTAHRALQNCGQVLRYAIATGRATQDVSSFLKGALPPTKKRHYPTITEPKKIGELLRAIDSYQGNIIVSCAMRMMPYVFVRPSELRKAEWAEFDLAKKEWRIPENRMKMGIQHIVPLSPQVLALLEELRPFSGYGRLLFPGMRTTDRAISDNTLNAALRRLGYRSDEMVMHGFRSMASTLLNEQGKADESLNQLAQEFLLKNKQVAELTTALESTGEWFYPESVAEACDAAQILYGSKLIFHERVAQTVAEFCLNNDLKAAAETVKTFKAMALYLHPMKFEWDNFSEELFRNETGITLSMTESRATKREKAIEATRTCFYNGRKITFYPHIKKSIQGIQMRLHFQFLTEERKILICHIGAHLPNAKTKHLN